VSGPQHCFSFSDFAWASAAGPAKTILADLDKAMASGGPPVHDLFAADLAALFALREAAGDGAMWLDGTDKKTGFATRYVVVGDNYLTVGVYPSERATAALSSGAADDTDIGFLYVTLVTGASATPRVTQLMSGMLTYRGDPLQQFTTDDGMKDLIDTLVSKAVDFVGGVFELAWEAGAAGDLGSAAAAAAGAVNDAASGASGRAIITGPGGFQIETDVLMTTGEAISLGLQVVALLALFSLNLLAKQMAAYVRVYNATAEPLDVSLAWLHEDDRYAGPTAIEFVTVAPVGKVWTPPWIIGGEAMSYAGWFVGNTDSLGRIAYVLRIAPTASFPGADVMVDVPNAGDNSLAVGVGAGEDYRGFWSANYGKNTSLVAADGGGPASPYRVRIATNQNHGTSPGPADGKVGYNYQHLVIVEPVA
jgi:hypothetical protein